MTLVCIASVTCEDQFDVLSMTNVPFPSSDSWAALTNASFDKDIIEFTICYRFQIESYNDDFLYPFHAAKNNVSERWEPNAYSNIGWDTGFEIDGYQPLHYGLERNVPGGGLANRKFPFYHHANLPANIETAEWYHICVSYSSLLQRIHSYQSGLKIFYFNYGDGQEDPLPRSMFERLKIGHNMRGLITDFNIYSTYFDDEAMISWTTGCNSKSGDIFGWDPRKLNTKQKEKSAMNVTFVQIDKSKVCIDPNNPLVMQEASKSAGNTNRKRFRPKPISNSSFVGSVLEVITTPNTIDAADARDRCFRLNGVLMSIPQNPEEQKLMDITLWDYMMKKASNNITHIMDNGKECGIWVEGETDISTEVFSFGSRELFYPKNGAVKHFHPWTGDLLRPNTILPGHGTWYKVVKECPLCFASRKRPVVGSYFNDRLDVFCMSQICTQKRYDSIICVFPKTPTFTLRGLCKNAAMDTKYKLAEHRPMDLGVSRAFNQWGEEDTRQYVGPKGWIISRNDTVNTWMLSHYHYKDLTLTMVDTDVLPLGRHKWRLENNVCNEGKTSSQILQLSGCGEEQFTCDDGKCLDIAQRCNNIEVGIWVYFLQYLKNII